MTDWTLIYQADNLIQAHCIKGLLEQAGIDVNLQGEALQGAIGELPAVGMSVDIRVEQAKLKQAKQLIQTFENTPQSQWLCQDCHEMNESTFEICWHCGHDPLSEIG